MKTALCLVVVLGLMVFCTEATSPRVCESCEVYNCPEMSCLCGTHKDECFCCNLCKKCAGEPCSHLESDVCEDGYVCAHAPGVGFPEILNNPGTCVPKEEAPEY